MFYLHISINDSNKEFPLITAKSDKEFKNLSDAADRAKKLIEILPTGSIIKVRRNDRMDTIITRHVA